MSSVKPLASGTQHIVAASASVNGWQRTDYGDWITGRGAASVYRRGSIRIQIGFTPSGRIHYLSKQSIPSKGDDGEFAYVDGTARDKRDTVIGWLEAKVR